MTDPQHPNNFLQISSKAVQLQQSANYVQISTNFMQSGYPSQAVGYYDGYSQYYQQNSGDYVQASGGYPVQQGYQYDSYQNQPTPVTGYQHAGGNYTIPTAQYNPPLPPPVVSEKPPLLPKATNPPKKKSSSPLGRAEGVSKKKSPLEERKRGGTSKKPPSFMEKKDSILKKVKDAPTFTQQLTILHTELNSIKVTHAAYFDKTRRIIADDLTRELEHTFPFHNIRYFDNVRSDIEFRRCSYHVHVTNARTRDDTEATTLAKIKDTIKASKIFQYLVSTHDKTVECVHCDTNIYIELTVNNAMANATNELIKYYLGLDEKLPVLLSAISFWADCFELKKIDMFSNYMLYVMTIFFLQQAPYNAPRVADLQTEENLIDGWNCAFKPLNYSNEELKRASLLDLFVGFFKFYSEFDYISFAICPFYGKPLAKVDFFRPETLPDCFARYKKNAHPFAVNARICIQDFFEHGRNIACMISFSHIDVVVALCKGGSDFVIDDEGDLLVNFLKSGLEDSHMKKSSFEVVRGGASDDGKTWFSLVKDMVLIIFRGVLYCRVKEVDNLPMETYPDYGDGKTVFAVAYFCKGSANVWDTRMEAAKYVVSRLPAGASELERELAVTDYLLGRARKFWHTEVLVVLFFKKEPVRVKVVMKALRECQHFAHLSHFLQVRLPQYVRVKGEEIERKTKEKSDKASKHDKTESILARLSPVSSEGSSSTISQQTASNKTESASDDKPCESTTEEKSEENKQEDLNMDEDDVPDDFFDDFANDDFIEGLEFDLDLEEETKTESTSKQPEEPETKKRKPSPIVFQQPKKPITQRLGYKPVFRKREFQKKTLSPEAEKFKPPRGKVPAFERDREKSRRDIMRDKMQKSREKIYGRERIRYSLSPSDYRSKTPEERVSGNSRSPRAKRPRESLKKKDYNKIKAKENEKGAKSSERGVQAVLDAPETPKHKLLKKCQEIIKTLSGQGNISPSGSFVLRTVTHRKPTGFRRPRVRFPYTAQPKNLDRKDQFNLVLNKILKEAKVLEECIDLGNCLEVERKKRIKTYVDVGIQCEDSSDVLCDVGVQADQNDLKIFEDNSTQTEAEDVANSDDVILIQEEHPIIEVESEEDEKKEPETVEIIKPKEEPATPEPPDPKPSKPNWKRQASKLNFSPPPRSFRKKRFNEYNRRIPPLLPNPGMSRGYHHNTYQPQPFTDFGGYDPGYQEQMMEFEDLRDVIDDRSGWMPRGRGGYRGRPFRNFQ